MRQILSIRLDILSTLSPSSASRSFNFSTLTILITTATTNFTLKIDMVHYSSSVGSNYTGPLDFVDNQTSFNAILNSVAVMLIAMSRSSRAIKESDTL